jgi:LuxR family transcriptional regulator, maltose regulon positive regulatory protein
MSAAPLQTPPRPRVHAQRPRPGLDIVESKIQVPSLRSGTVSRTALVNRLRATSDSVVTVIAPAGYGKTTLLVQLGERDTRPYAWISVDERDRDPVVLLRHIAAALDMISPLPRSVFEALWRTGSPAWPSAVPRVGAALRAIDEPLVLVLDNAHMLRSRESLDAVAALADHLPRGSLLIVAGRTTPKLPIASFRAAGRLVEIEMQELALNAREGQLLLRATGADLPLSDVTELVQHCEGWPVAVYLASLGLGDDAGSAEDCTRLLEFDGGDRDLADYLRTEYLAKLRPGALRFLRRTSILGRMSGPLCDAVLRDEGSAHELERVERANLFLIPLDRRRVWYRYHRLFRELLRRELLDREPALVPILHRRAASWYEANGEPEAALEHAHAAGDRARAARVITATALPVYQGGRATTVEAWLARFDDPTLLRRYPAVALQGSWIHALRGRPVARRWLDIVEHGTFKAGVLDRCKSLRPWISVLHAAFCDDGVDKMVSDAESGLSKLRRDSQFRPSALVVLGAGHMLCGQNERADEIFAEAASEADRLGAADMRVLALSERALIASANDDPLAAEKYARTASELVEKGGLDGYLTSAIAFATSARAALRHGLWDEARSQLARAEALRPALVEAPFPWLALQSKIELARAYLALRDRSFLPSLLADIKDLVRRAPHLGVLVDEVQVLEREIAELPELGSESGAGLTMAELRLLPFLATHLSFREIGEQLFVSRNTIKTQAISVYRKLGVSSRSDAIDCATDLGLVEAASPLVSELPAKHLQVAHA